MRRPRMFIGPSGMGGMVGLWGGSSLIASVQRGSITVGNNTSNTATITGVDTTRSVLIADGWGQQNVANSYDARMSMSNVALTNSTTITASKNVADPTNTYTVGFTVVEFMPGVVKSLQYGATAGGSDPTNITITSVRMDKTLTFNRGTITAFPTYDAFVQFIKVQLTTSTNLALVGAGQSNGTNTSWSVVEFF